jgi:hypothetical protein
VYWIEAEFKLKTNPVATEKIRDIARKKFFSFLSSSGISRESPEAPPKAMRTTEEMMKNVPRASILVTLYPYLK